MALVNMRDLLNHAYQNQYAVGAFDLVSLDFLEAVVSAAEESRAAVILSLAEPHFEHYDVELMLAAVECAARRTTVPVAIQLDHGSSLESAIRAINLGCNGVMVDASDQSLPDNIRTTRAVVETAHGCGVSVFGELGYVAGVEGEGAKIHPGEPTYTTVAEAKGYVERTGVDCLAVSIGTVQGHAKGRPKLDIRRLKDLNQALQMPLEIHGGSGLNEDQFHKLTSNGVAKINYYTALSDVAADAMRKSTKANPKGSFIDLKRDVKRAVQAEVERCLKLWGSAGRAAEILEQCASWNPVDEQLLFNVIGSDATEVEQMCKAGARRLSEMAGVRHCTISVQEQNGNGYPFCCQIRFVSPEALRESKKSEIYRTLVERKWGQMIEERLQGSYQLVSG